MRCGSRTRQLHRLLIFTFRHVTHVGGHCCENKRDREGKDRWVVTSLYSERKKDGLKVREAAYAGRGLLD